MTSGGVSQTETLLWMPLECSTWNNSRLPKEAEPEAWQILNQNRGLVQEAVELGGWAVRGVKVEEPAAVPEQSDKCASHLRVHSDAADGSRIKQLGFVPDCQVLEPGRNNRCPHTDRSGCLAKEHGLPLPRLHHREFQPGS